MNLNSIPEQSKWFIRTTRGETRGPFTGQQIAELIATEKITVSTPISRTAGGPFRTLTEFPELATPTSPPPIAPTNDSITKHLPRNIVFLIACAFTSLFGLSILITVLTSSKSDSKTSHASPDRPHSHSDRDVNDFTSQENVRLKEDLQDSNSSVGSHTPPALETKESNPSPPSTFEDVVAKTEKSVCRIQAEGIGGGSGFLIDIDKVMTNKHVVDCMLGDEIEVSFPNNPSISSGKLPAKVVYEDRKLDVAILKIPSVSAPPLSIGSDTTGRIRRGLDVVAIGSPGVQIVTGQTIENAVSRGLLSSETIIDGIVYYQASIAINPGNSGGPILDLNGDVVGMVTLKDTSVEGMAFAVPCFSLREIAKTFNIQFNPLDKMSLERLEQEHDARVITNRITELLVYDLVRLSEIVGNTIEGITDFNLEANTALSAARDLDWQKDHSGYVALESITVSSIKKIAAAKQLNENVRLKIAELWGLSRELHGYVISPRGSVNSLKNKITEIQDKAVRLRSELNTLLDFGQ